MTDHEFADNEPRLYDRIAIVGVILLLAAFLLGVASVTAGTANGSGDDLVAKRDSGEGGDDGGDDDDEGDDDGDTATATGTTQGTGPSNTATNDTATGTKTVER